MLDIQFSRTPFGTVTKSYRGDNGEMYVEGVASTVNLDRTKEKMSPDAIKLMALGFKGKTLNSEHHNDWDDDLGKIVDSQVLDANTAQPKLWIKAKLNDWLTRSKDLFEGLQSGGLSGLGLSVEGKINPGGLVKEFDETLGRYVPVYKDIAPTAVAITNKPANLDTFVDAVTKSIKIEDLPEETKGAYIVVRKFLDGQQTDEGVCNDELCAHQKCLNGTCKNFCDKCGGVAMSAANKTLYNQPNKPDSSAKDSSMSKDIQVDPLNNTNNGDITPQPTLTCSHGVCNHGMCMTKGCNNMCKICTTAKAVDVAYAGGVPHSGLARQDIANVDESKTSTEKATTPDPTNTQNVSPEGAQPKTDEDLKNPPAKENCADDYCEHGNCLEESCPNSCQVCAFEIDETLEPESDKLEPAGVPDNSVGKADPKVTNAHQTKPSKYKDVPSEKFLDPENHKYPADAKHLPAALAYFNHPSQRSKGGYTPEKWATMGSKLAGLLGGGYHYDSSSEKVVTDSDKGETSKSVVKGGDEMNNQQQRNQGVLQKSPYTQEVLDIVKAWGSHNPGNQALFAKADASAVPANGTVQAQQTVQKGSSSSGSSDDSSSSGSGSSSSDSGSSDSGSSTSSGSSSSGDSLSSLLSSVLTTLSDMKSSVSGSSSGSSSDSSGSGSSSSDSDKTSTDKAFPFNGGSSASSVSDKTSTDKALSDMSSADDSSDTVSEATKALSLALEQFTAVLAKAKKQPQDGKFPESGTQQATPQGKEGNDAVNGAAQEADYHDEAKRQHPMPKANTHSSDNNNGSAQEANYNSLASKSVVANEEKFIKSIDVLTALMTKIGEKVETVEGKVEALPGVRKGVAVAKNFVADDQADVAKNEAAYKAMEAKIIADPSMGFKELHAFRTYGQVPAKYAAQ